MTINKVKIGNGEAKWEVRYRVNGRNSTRVRRRFDTRSDAEAFLSNQLVESRKLKMCDVGIQNFEETTFSKEAAYWLQHRSQTFSPGHLKRVKGIIQELLPNYGTLSPKFFHAGRLTQIQTEMLQQNLNAATVNRKLEVIVAIFNFSAKNRRIPYNPSVGYEKLKEVREEMRFWEHHEAEKFLTFANRKYPNGSSRRWIYVAYLVTLNTAARAGEIWGLQPQDLKKNGKVLHIQRQLDRVALSFRTPKGKKSRFVPCNEELRKELYHLIESDEIRPDRTIFQNEEGNPVCHDNFAKRVFEKDVREAGVPSIRFHDLRHTGTTLMIAEGLNLNTVKEICGHKSIQTTMNYIHLLGDSIIDTAESFSIKPVSNSTERKERALHLVKA